MNKTFEDVKNYLRCLKPALKKAVAYYSKYFAAAYLAIADSRIRDLGDSLKVTQQRVSLDEQKISATHMQLAEVLIIGSFLFFLWCCLFSFVCFSCSKPKISANDEIVWVPPSGDKSRLSTVSHQVDTHRYFTRSNGDFENVRLPRTIPMARSSKQV